MSLLEKDEKLQVLKKKLVRYENKMEEVRKMYYSLSDKSNVSKVMETINKAINVTKNLITDREKELMEKEKEMIENTEYEQGQYVYAKYRGSWHTASVTSIVRRESVFTFEYGVTFVGLTQGNENEEEEPQKVTSVVSPSLKNIKPYTHPIEYIRKGVKIQAVYEHDGKFYPGRIDSLDDHGWVWVKYKGFRGVFKLRLELVRLVGEYGDNVYGKGEEVEVEEVEESGDKKKKVEKRKRKDEQLDKRAKKRQKRKEKNAAVTKMMEDKKNNWMSFLSKSKSMKGVVSTRRPTDIAREKKMKDIGGTRNAKQKVVVKRQTFEAKNVIDEYKTLKKFEEFSQRKGDSRGNFNDMMFNDRDRDRDRYRQGRRGRDEYSSRRDYRRDDHRRDDYSRRDFRRDDYRRDDYDRRRRY